MNAKVRRTRIRCGECNGRKNCRVIAHLGENACQCFTRWVERESAYRSYEHDMKCRVKREDWKGKDCVVYNWQQVGTRRLGYQECRGAHTELALNEIKLRSVDVKRLPQRTKLF